MKLKRIFSLLMVCLIAVSAIGVISYAENDSVKNMLHVTGAGKNTNYLQKTANLINGETYTVSFQYRDSSEQLNTSYWFYVTKAQRIVENVDGKGKKFFDGRESDTFVKIEEGTGGWQTLSYTFVFADHDNVDIPDGTVKTDIGFMIADLASDFYFANMTVYKTSDAQKTNLLLVPTDDDGLNGWHRNYAMAEDGSTIFTSTAYTVECLEYDENLFMTELTGNYMLHVNAVGGSTKPLQKTAELTKGKTYVATFKYKAISGLLDSDFYFCVTKPQQVVENSEVAGKKYFDSRLNQFDSVNPVDGVSQLEYTFTLTDRDDFAFDSGTVKYDIGFCFESGKTANVYIADFAVYETDDATKKNLLAVPGYSKGLYGWHSDYYAADIGAKTLETSAYTAECVKYNASYFELELSGNYMLHVNAVGGSVKPLQKTAMLTKGKTYVATFKYKAVSGALDKDFYFCVSKAQQVIENTEGKGTRYFDSHKNQFDSVNKLQDVSQFEYKFTLTDRDEIIFESGTAKYDIGFYFENGKQSEIYVADFCVYDFADAAKTNLLSVPDYSKGMYGWHSDYYAAEENSLIFSNSAYTAEYVVYDETLFENVSGSHNMIHVVATGENAGVLQKTANLVNGKTYTVSFQYKDAAKQLNNRFWFVVTKAQQIVENVEGKGTRYFDGRDEDTFVKVEEGKDGWRTLSYTFVFADHGTVDIPDGTVTADIGFTFSNYTAEFYFADMTVYEASDPDKTNLLFIPTDDDGLNGWHRNYAMAEDGSTTFTSAAYTAECLPYDEELFIILPGSHHMIHVVATGENSGVLQKTAKLIKGRTYTVSFKYKPVSGQLNGRFWFVVTKAQQIVENVEGKGTKYFDGRDEDTFIEIKDDYEDFNLISYTFLFDDHNGIIIPDGTVKTDIGFAFPNYSAELYFADMTIYETSDPDKTNLLLVPTDDNGLNGWHRNYAMAEDGSTTFTSAAYTVECLPYDDALFVKEKPIEYPEQICYFQNGPSWGAFASSAKVTIGKTYYFEYSVASISRVVLYAATTGKRESILGDEQEIERKEYDDYYHVVYAITIPEKANKGTPMTSYAFVGINIPAGVGGYIFDMHLYDADDPTKKELLPNPGFKKGLDEYVFDWAAWFIDERDGLGVREWSNATKTLRLFDYDLSKIIQYTDDSRFHDGVWWKPKDLANERDKGIAVVKGIIKNQRNAALSGVKVCLSSKEEEYFTKTSASGRFQFLNIPAGFYELFTVDKDGTRYATDFFTNIASEEEYSLDIVCAQIDDYWDDADDADDAYDADYDEFTETVSVGSVKGNLYTPDRKPVNNCKIYMRNVGEIITDKEGYFEFIDVPVGSYDIYIIDAKGAEIILKTVIVKENIESQLKLKYEIEAQTTDNVSNLSQFIYIALIGAGVLLLVGGGIIVILIIKKKKRMTSV